MIFTDNMPALTKVYKQYIVNLKNGENFKNEEMKNEVRIPMRMEINININIVTGIKHLPRINILALE